MFGKRLVLVACVALGLAAITLSPPSHVTLGAVERLQAQVEQAQGDLSTLAGSGFAEAGVATAEADTAWVERAQRWLQAGQYLVKFGRYCPDRGLRPGCSDRHVTANPSRDDGGDSVLHAAGAGHGR